MEPTEHILGRVHAAYERARLLAGLRTALYVAPLVIVSFGGCGRGSMSIAIGSVLAALVCFLTWRGDGPGRAVVPGLLAGTISLASPLFACRVLQGLGTSGAVLIGACSAGGIVAGWVVARFAGREPEHRARFIVAGGVVAALSGTLGCIDVGLGGVGAMVVCLAIVSPLGLRPTEISS